MTGAREMGFEARHRAEGITRSLTIAGRDAADVIFLSEGDGFFAGAAFFPEGFSVCVHALSVKAWHEKI